MSWTELTRFSTRQAAEELCFTLRTVELPTRLEPQQVTGNGSGQVWLVLVPESDLERARQILKEEAAPSAKVLPLPVGPRSRPGLYWVVGLAVANFLLWWLMEASGGSESRQVLIRFGAAHVPSIREGQLWRLLSAVFLHIGARHLLGNTATLLIFGPAVLRAWGVCRFYFFYLSCGVAGNLVSFLLFHSAGAKAGASGAILGLLGVLAGTRIRLARQPGYRSRFKTWHVLAMVLAFYGFVVGVGPADHLAHLGGLLTGGLLSLLLPLPGQQPRRQELLLDGVLGGLSALALVTVAILAFRQATGA